MRRVIGLFCLAVLSFLSSCEEEGKIEPSQSSAVQDQATADAYFNDASDLSASAYSSPSQSNLSGRTASGGKLIFSVIGDTRFNGAVLTLEATGTISIPQGTISIDFGAGTTDPSGIVRKGKIMVAYYGYRFVAGSYFVVMFDGYEVNGIKIEGKRTVTTTSVTSTNITFVVKDENGKITLTDGSVVTRVSDHTRKWLMPTATSKGQWLVEGTASGVTRDSKNYSVLITTPLLFKAECALNKIFIPSEGEATLTVDGAVIQLIYGTAGDVCDKVISVNAGGISQSIIVN